jgi:hypothetical protein
MAELEKESIVQKATNPLVFISHDTRDAELAEAFSALLKSVSAGVLKSFRSSDKKGNQGIEYGIEWYPEIIKNIQCASDIVCLLTKRSIDRPWLLFEAGMAKGKLDTPILGVALGVELKDVSTGPFAQFQNCADDEESITKLVFQLVNRIPNSEPDRDTIIFQVGKFKLNIQEILKKLETKDTKKDGSKDIVDKDIENTSVKLFEEIKLMFNDLPSRLDKMSFSDDKKRRRRLHPGMLEDIMHMNENPRLGIRIGLSFYRDTMPWVYEEGNYLLNSISEESNKDENDIYVQFKELLMGNKNMMMFEEYTMNNKDDYILFKELPMMIMKNVERLLNSKRRNLTTAST